MHSPQSPLPWKIEKRVSQGIFIVGNIPDGYDKTVCLMQWTSPLVSKDVKMVDAEFIVRACNSYSDLLETLEKAKSAVEWMAEATDSDPEDHELLETVNKAIAKAKE